MTREELTRFDGREGRPAYVAVGGIIYDLSDSPLWQNGTHEGAHQAGADLTLELKGAPHVAAVVERFPSIGRLEDHPVQPPRSNKWMTPLIVVAIALLLFWLLLR